MYGRLWRVLPGGPGLRVLALAILAVAVVAACFLWVFPAIAPHLPINDGTVDH